MFRGIRATWALALVLTGILAVSLPGDTDAAGSPSETGAPPAPQPKPTPALRPVLSPAQLEALEQTRLCLENARAKGIDACRRALALGLSPSRKVIVQKALARKLAGVDRWPEVIDVYRQLVALRPEESDTHARLGDALLHGQDQQQEAEAEYRKALGLKPNDLRALLGLALALEAQGRFGEAVAAFEQVIELDPTTLDQRPGARTAFEAARRGERWP